MLLSDSTVKTDVVLVASRKYVIAVLTANTQEREKVSDTTCSPFSQVSV